MQSERALTMTTTKTQNFESTGGFGGLSPQDIAHALGGLRSAPYHLALAIYTGDIAAAKEVRHSIMTLMDGKIRKIPGYLRILSDIAIAEVIGDWNCPDCHGRGFVGAQHSDQTAARNSDGLLVKPCETCDESGMVRMTDHEKAEILSEVLGKDITAKTWMHLHSWDYSAVLSQVMDWKNEADRHINSRLSDSMGN